MAGLSVTSIVEQLSSYFLRYYETAYTVRDEAVQQERADLLRQHETLFQRPYIDILPEFVRAADDLQGSCAAAGAPRVEGAHQGVRAATAPVGWSSGSGTRPGALPDERAGRGPTSPASPRP